MKISLIFLICFCLTSPLLAQLNTFKEGDVISAEQMNQNFEYLEQQFRMSLATAVDCDAGETINGAIENGFNDITVSGTCNENLSFVDWDDSPRLAPRYLKLIGGDSTAKIVDASGGADSTIFVGAGTTLSIENLAISGGSWGLGAYRNSNLLLSGVTIEGFTKRGISIGDSSYLGVNDGGVTITGETGSEFGIYLVTGSSGWVHTATISGTKTGVTLHGGSFLYLFDFTIDVIERGISVHDQSTVLKVNEGVGVIEGTSDRAITVGRASFYSWDPGSLTIQNLNGGRGIEYELSDGVIYNLKMPDFNNVGSGWNPALELSAGSTVSINSAEISGSTDGTLVSIEEGSVAHFRESTLTIGSAGNGIEVFGSSRFNFQNSTISGSVAGSLVSISDGSSAKIQDSTIETNSADNVLIVRGTSRLELNESQVNGNVTNNIINIENGSSAGIHDSTIDMTNGDWGTAILISAASTLTTGGTEITSNKIGLYVERNSFADFGSGSSIKAGSLYTAGAVVGSSGMRIRPGSRMSSEGAAAMEIKNSSYALAMDGANIDRTDVGVDVEIGQMSSLTIWGSDIVGEVTCWGRSLVFPQNGAIITNLDPNCSEYPILSE